LASRNRYQKNCRGGRAEKIKMLLAIKVKQITIMIWEKKKKNLILRPLLVSGLLVGLVGSFLLPSFVLAESCPSKTTVNETTVTLVGELTDLIGDKTTSVWFQYGRTKSYGQKTSEEVLTQPGVYCITVSGLLPSRTYHYRTVARSSAGTRYGEDKYFTTTSDSEPLVDIEANGSDGPIRISYNSSATLTWDSSDADSCYASGAWSGTKTLSGSQSTGRLTSSRTYTLTCTNSEGSVSDSVRVNVDTDVSPGFAIGKSVKNLSRGTAFSESVYAQPGERLTFMIVVQAGRDSLYDIVVKDTLPRGLIYRGDLRVDNVLTSGNIITGLNIGDLAAGERKAISFRADVAGAGSFTFGRTELTNTVLVSSGDTSRWDNAKVSVSRTAVAGTATEAPTGLTNNLFSDSFFLPLLITLLIIWLLKSRILKFEEWLDIRKKQYQIYKSNKMLQLRIAQAKAKEFFQQKT